MAWLHEYDSLNLIFLILNQTVRDFLWRNLIMTEETSNVQNVTENVQPVATPATNTEKTRAVTMKTYYWSTDDVPFRVMTSNDEITANQYPLVVTAPDPSLKSPKYDWTKGEWYDISKESYGQRLTAVTESLKTLEGSITSLQEAHKDTLQSAEANDKVMDQLQATVQQTNRMVASLSAMMAALNKNSQSNNNEVAK